MGIKIEFDTDTIDDRGARALTAFLAALMSKAENLPHIQLSSQGVRIVPGNVEVDRGDDVDEGPGFDTPQPTATVSAEEAFAPAPPAPAATTPGVEVDKSGIPWNPEYHSTPAKINASDGLWRRKRGVDPSAVPAGPTPIAPPPAPAAPPAPPAPAAPAAPVATGAVDFTALMQLNKRLADSGKIAPTAIMELAKEEGGDIGLAMTNPDLCARLFARLQAFDA